MPRPNPNALGIDYRKSVRGKVNDLEFDKGSDLRRFSVCGRTKQKNAVIANDPADRENLLRVCGNHTKGPEGI